ncbi:traB domain-containing protein-like [Salvia divinorum]|uniref:TraB domain-containing protein-like n=1 Tax=Salvia divinorum TaxID=28513 RepID=A0ABD1I477_SALDI
MYGLNRLSCPNHLVAAASTYSKPLFRLNPQLRSIALTHSSRRRVMDPPSPAATAGIGDFVNVDKEGRIPGEDDEALPENESAISDSYNGYERRVLPPELSRSVATLTCESAAHGGVCDVYLVGTAHVSTESCQEVQAVIEFLKPQVVFLELCSSRVTILTPQNFKVPTTGEMVDMWKKNQNLFGILYSWFLAKVASQLEVLPGAEFRVAYEEAMKYGGKVILGDRPVQITLRRTWAKMPLWHKIKLLYSLLFQAVFLPNSEDLAKALKEMDDAETLPRVIQDMTKKFPSLMETLVRERDQYMSAMLLKVAREHNSVVAVVGKGHLPGIQKNWEQPVEVKQLLNIPSEKRSISVFKILSFIGVTVAGVAIVSGIHLSVKK